MMIPHRGIEDGTWLQLPVGADILPRNTSDTNQGDDTMASESRSEKEKNRSAEN
jgi:hypothetical protein